MTKFTTLVQSDDIITFEFNGKSMEFGEAEMHFLLTLPNGQKIPGKVDYTSNGWEFSLDLPNSTVVGIIEPTDADAFEEVKNGN